MPTPMTTQEVESLHALLQADTNIYTLLPTFVNALEGYERNADFYKLITVAAQALFDAQLEKKILLKQETLEGYIEFVERIMPAIERLIALFEPLPATIKAENPELSTKSYAAYLRRTIANFSQANLFNPKLLPHLSTYPGLIWQPVDGINAHYFYFITAPSSLKQKEAVQGLAIALNAYLQHIKKDESLFTKQNHQALLRLTAEVEAFSYRFKKLYPLAWVNDALAQHVKRLVNRLNQGVSPTIISHPTLFQRKDIHDRIEPLATATVLAFDWDDTLCNKKNNEIAKTTQDLLKLIHEFDFYTLFIITARNEHVEKGAKKIEVHVIEDDNVETIIDYTHPAPIHGVLEATQLTAIFHPGNTVYCNFERFEVVEEGVLKTSFPAQLDKHTKNLDYHTTLINKKLFHSECIIFDDSLHAWEHRTLCGFFFEIDNASTDKRCHVQYSLGMTFAQTLLHNNNIAIEKRQLFAARLVQLFEKHGMGALNTPLLLKFAAGLSLKPIAAIK